MKPYGRDHEARRIRICPDKVDIAELGLSSRHGGLSSKGRRETRRRYAKAERRAARKLMSAASQPTAGVA